MSRSWRGPGVSRLRASRHGLVRGAKGERKAVTIVFRLSRPGVVVFRVTQVAPDCRPAGTFSVRGRAGVNRIHFAGRVAKRLLPPGTYKLGPRIGRTAPPSVVVVILPRGADLHDAKRLRSLNVCRAEQATAAADARADSFASAFGFGLGFGGGSDGLAVAGPLLGSAGATGGSLSPSSSGSGSSGGTDSDGGSIGTVVPRIGRALGITSPAQITETFDSPWVFAGLALAILLLALAAAPRAAMPHPRLTALVAYRRLELAVAGASALTIVTVAYVLSVM